VTNIPAIGGKQTFCGAPAFQFIAVHHLQRQ
jgi:hypothetical protein